MKYTKNEIWKNSGLINTDMNLIEQEELVENLSFGKDLILCYKITNGDIDFYNEIENILYPIIVYYTLIGKNACNNIDKFIDFCDKNLRTKYDINKYNDDYLLCQEFIKLNN